jgi:hypothetical protein
MEQQVLQMARDRIIKHSKRLPEEMHPRPDTLKKMCC